MSRKSYKRQVCRDTEAHSLGVLKEKWILFIFAKCMSMRVFASLIEIFYLNRDIYI